MANKTVKNKTKPKIAWSREHCEKYYVECVDNISLRQLSTISGRHHTTLASWSSKDTWVKKREQYRREQQAIEKQARSEAVEQAIRKSKVEYQEVDLDKMEALYSELGAIAYSIYQAHRSEMDMCRAMYNIMGREIMMIQRLPADQQNVMLKQKIDMRDFNNISQALNRASSAIAAVTGLPYYVNTNVALKRVKQDGYEPIPISNSNENEFAELEADLRDFNP